MSKISISGASTGSATFTIESPATSTNRTLTLPDATGTVVVSGTTPSLNGITFPATQVASAGANTLDDYEEGTWTPTVISAGYTLASSEGRYTKIGRMVCVTCRLNFSAVNGSGNSLCNLESLPFAAQGNPSTGVFRENSVTGAIYVFMIQGSDQTVARINSYSSAVSGNARTLATGENYDGCAVYFI